MDTARNPATWTDVPLAFADQVLQAHDQDELIVEILRRPGGLTAKQQHAVMHPSGGVAAILMPPRPGQRVLILGVGNSTLPIAVASFGAIVTCADWSAARLHFARLLGEPLVQGSWHALDAGADLPFDDRSFDVVIADLDELQRVADGAVSEILADVRRVLAREGRLVLSVSNRLRRWRSIGVTGIARAIRSPWSAEILSGAGFGGRRVLVPYPNQRNWKWMTPLDRLREPIGERADLVDKRSTMIRLWKGLARLGLGRWISEDFFVLAHVDGDDELAIFTDTLDATAGEPSPRLRSLTDARVAVVGQQRFAKVPLSAFQQAALVDEVHKTELARNTPFAAYTLTGGRVRDHHGVAVTDFPFVDADIEGDNDPEAAVLQILAEIPADHTATLADTTFWSRLTSDHGESECATAGATGLRAHVIELHGASRLPIGPTHGDLHPGNVMFVDRRPLLVDWNRFELANPLFLDSLYALVLERQQRHGTRFVEELVAYADGVTSGPLSELVDRTLGDLTGEQASLILLLDRTVSYSESRGRFTPWMLSRLTAAATTFAERLEV